MSTREEQGRQSQKWCKTCNLWIANNKVQIEQHENGSKHQAATEKLLKDIAKKNEAKRRDEQVKESTIVTKKRKANQAAADLLTHVTTFSHVPVTDGNDIKVKENNLQEEDTYVKIETTETDENGYPLPAEKVYGEWTVVEDENPNEDEENIEKTSEGNNENGSDEKEEKEDENVGTRTIFEGAFKRRVASGSRRKRKRR